jgi:hypothetical protein
MSAGQSSVGNRSLYEAGDQRNAPQSEINVRERYKEGEKHSHKNLDSSMFSSFPFTRCSMSRMLTRTEDERSIANKLAAREKQPDPSHHHNNDVDPEAELSKKNPTMPVCLFFYFSTAGEPGLIRVFSGQTARK